MLWKERIIKTGGRGLLFIACTMTCQFVAGSQWVTQRTGTNTSPIWSVHFVDNSTGWAAYFDTVLWAQNGGASWNALPVRIPCSLTGIYFVDVSTGYAVGGKAEGAAIIKSTDGGATWIDVSSTAATFMNGVFFLNEAIGWAFGVEGSSTPKIVKTTDGGANWVDLSIESQRWYLLSGYFVDTLVGWAVGRELVLKTTDGGASWREQDTAFTHQEAGDVRSVYFVNRDTGWYVGGISGYSFIAKTVNGGKTWTHNESPLPGFWVGRLDWAQFVNKDTGWTVGRLYPVNEGLILRTTDGGLTWSRQDIPTGTQQLTSVSFSDAQHGWAVGWNGTILATTNGGVTFVKENAKVPHEYTLEQNYPNPFNPSTVIRYQIATSSMVSLKVYDVLGQEVATLVNEIKDAGTYSVRFDARQLASGVYFCRMIAGNYTDVRKLIVMK